MITQQSGSCGRDRCGAQQTADKRSGSGSLICVNSYQEFKMNCNLRNKAFGFFFSFTFSFTDNGSKVNLLC